MKRGDLVRTVPSWSYKTWTGVVLDTLNHRIRKHKWILVHCTEPESVENKYKQWVPATQLEVINEKG